MKKEQVISLSIFAIILFLAIKVSFLTSFAFIVALIVTYLLSNKTSIFKAKEIKQTIS